MPWILVCLGAFVLRAATPGMGTDMWLLEREIFFLPGVLIQHMCWIQNSFLTACESVPDGGKKKNRNKSCLFFLNKKRKEIHLGFVHSAVFVLEQRRTFLLSSFCAFCSQPPAARRKGQVCLVCCEARISPALPARCSVVSGSANKTKLCCGVQYPSVV